MTVRDMRCEFDLDLFAEECADEAEEIEQDALHRMLTRRGQNIDDYDFGESILDWLSIAADDPTVAAQRLEEEFKKDLRIKSAQVKIERVGVTGAFDVSYEIAPVEGATILRTQRVVQP
jgi:hypothetical protein